MFSIDWVVGFIGDSYPVRGRVSLEESKNKRNLRYWWLCRTTEKKSVLCFSPTNTRNRTPYSLTINTPSVHIDLAAVCSWQQLDCFMHKAVIRFEDKSLLGLTNRGHVCMQSVWYITAVERSVQPIGGPDAVQLCLVWMGTRVPKLSYIYIVSPVTGACYDSDSLRMLR